MWDYSAYIVALKCGDPVYLGLDPGGKTGVAVLNEDGNVLTAASFLAEESVAPLDILATLFHDGVIVGCEYICSQSTAVLTRHATAVIAGTIGYLCYKHSNAVYLTHAASARKRLVGNAKASSAEIRQWMRMRHGTTFDDHAHDAILAAMIARIKHLEKQGNYGT
jgi:Holliday junction resolvasome RuvABC endonuclease subunit